MFIASLFIIVKIWKYQKGPSTDEWIIHTLFSHRREENPPFTTT